MSTNCEDCLDLFAIAKAIATRYEEERKLRQRDQEIENEAYADEAREQARLQADWWTDFRDRSPR